MEDRPSNEIVNNSGQSERQIVGQPGKKSWKERFEKLLKIRKILLIAVLLISALPFFVCVFGDETESIGEAIFILSIVLLAPVGVGYIITLIQTIRTKKKVEQDYIIPVPSKAELFALPAPKTHPCPPVNFCKVSVQYTACQQVII